MSKLKQKFERVPAAAYQAVGFMAAFAVIAGVFQYYHSTHAAAVFLPYPPHHSTCTLNIASKNPVLTGETFTATVSMRNDGTSTYDPAYGTYLSEYNGGNQTNTWNVKGNTLSGKVAPGGTAVFHLTVTAPSTAGKYEFDWAMAVVFNGVMHNPCTGGSITVNKPAAPAPAPAPAPVINSFTANPTNVSSGGTSLLNWTSSNTTKCSINPGLATAAASGSWRTPALTTSTSYTLTCASSTAQVSKSLSVTVNSTPAPAPPPSSTPSSSPKSTATPVQNPTYKAPAKAATYTPPGSQTPVTDQPAALGTYGAAFTVEPAGASKVSIAYGTDTSVSQQTDQVVTNGQTTPVAIQQLQPATTYYFQVIRYSATGTASKGTQGQFTTKGFNVIVAFTKSSGLVEGIETTIPELQLEGTSDGNGTVYFSEVTPGSYTLHYTVDGAEHQQSLDVTSNPVPDTDPTQPATADINVGINLDASVSTAAGGRKSKAGAVAAAVSIALLLAAAGGVAWWWFARRQRQPKMDELVRFDPNDTAADMARAPHAGESLKDMVLEGLRDEAQRRNHK